jgi:hypothetical protein
MSHIDSFKLIIPVKAMSQAFVGGTPVPHCTWTEPVEAGGTWTQTVTATGVMPTTVKLHWADNPVHRDFRYSQKFPHAPEWPTGYPELAGTTPAQPPWGEPVPDIALRSLGGGSFEVTVREPQEGWRAFIVEMVYNNFIDNEPVGYEASDEDEDLTLTTPLTIAPNGIVGNPECGDPDCLDSKYHQFYDRLADDDGDGMPNFWEDEYGLEKTNPADAYLDPDGDSYDNGSGGDFEVSMTNRLEYFLGTNPNSNNSDEDVGIILDGSEVYSGTDPLNALDPQP